MNYSELLLFIAVFSVIGGLASAVLITIFLQKESFRANIIFWGFYFIRYLRQYKELTLIEQGKIGLLYYSYIVFFNIALMSVILGLLIR